MKTTKTIKEVRYVRVREEITREVPLWYINFLRWVFFSDESFIKSEIEEEKQRAFWAADKNARSFKEDLMQKKLYELGYQVFSTCPMAKEVKKGDTPTYFDYNKEPFVIVERELKR